MAERMDLSQTIATLQRFHGANLTQTLATLEASVRGANLDNCVQLVTAGGATNNVLAAASLMKQLAAENNVVIHALGILLCLPHLLEKGETIDYVSLGAGNTGRSFDLETNKRIGEFKFIRWQGGPESIRQNGIFKDFYWMAEDSSAKRKYLYLLDTKHPLKFFNGGRALSSVLSRDVKLREDMRARYGERYRTVCDYYAAREKRVILQDVSKWVPGLAE